MRYINTRSIDSIANILEKYNFKNDRDVYLKTITPFLLIRKKTKLTKGQRKRLARKKHREFIYNIVMQHHRLHDENRKKFLTKKKEKLSNHIEKPRLKEIGRAQLFRSDMIDKKAVLKEAKDRIYARRVRARSRWMEVVESRKYL